MCTCCRKRPVRVKKFGWCRACYDRWRYAGRPAEGPPTPSKGGRPRDPETVERVLETGELLKAGWSGNAIAAHFAVTPAAVCYYRKRLDELDKLEVDR